MRLKPFTVRQLYLQAAFIVLEDQGEQVAVFVGAHALSFSIAKMARVMNKLQKLIRRIADDGVKGVRRLTQRQGKRFKQAS